MDEWRHETWLIYREREEDGGRWSDWQANTSAGLMRGWDKILRALDIAGGVTISLIAERAEGNVHSM